MKNKDTIFGGKGYISTKTKIMSLTMNFMLMIIQNPQHSFEGNLTVMKPSHIKPLIIFGQDRCISKQYTFGNKCGAGPNSKVTLMTKDEGKGLMISAFINREYSFNWKLIHSQLDLVNKSRENWTYIMKKLQLLKEEKQKRKLTCSPFQQCIQ